MNKRKSILRGAVYVVENDQGGIYTLCPYDESIAMVTVEQVVIWSEDSYVRRSVSRALYTIPVIDMLDIPFVKGSVLSGEIITVQQTEPVDIDNPLDHLLQDGKIRTEEGAYIWQYSYYNPDIEHDPKVDVDELIMILSD